MTNPGFRPIANLSPAFLMSSDLLDSRNSFVATAEIAREPWVGL
jgi:hypothetical protein